MSAALGGVADRSGFESLCPGALASHHSPKAACGRGHLAASPHWRINASEMAAFSHLSLATSITTAATATVVEAGGAIVQPDAAMMPLLHSLLLQPVDRWL